jgi:hypothetical protein
MRFRPVLVMLGLALALSACGGSPKLRAAQDTNNETQRQGLEAQIRSLPSVTTADLLYANRFGDAGNLVVMVKAKPGTDTASLADTLVGMAWKTSLDPLRGMLIEIDTGVPSERLDRNVVISEEAKDLQAKYGPRQSSSAST